jgi:hypothetical protein
MRMRNSLLLAAGLSAGFCGTAMADSEWQTVTLDGNVTIDVPAVVGSDYKPSGEGVNKGTVMFFAVTTDSHGDLECLLSHHPYTKDFTHTDAVEKLADSRRDVLCRPTDATIRSENDESESLSVSGYPAGRCAASYTDPSEKNPGMLDANMGVAAPDAFYMLSCTVSAAEQDDAVSFWMMRWDDEIQHIQQSLTLASK